MKAKPEKSEKKHSWVLLTVALCLTAALYAQDISNRPNGPGVSNPAEHQGPASNGEAPVHHGVDLALPHTPDPAAVARGKQLYTSSCSFCHGADATGGDSGPNLVRSVVVLHDQGSGSSVGPVILNGRLDRGMPKFPFTSPQISDIAAFLLSRILGAANRRTYEVQILTTGNATAGKEFFARHCSQCHSTSGDLAHVAKDKDPAHLEALFLYPPVQKLATVTLPSGEKVSGILVQLDDFEVILRTQSGQLRSWSLDAPHRIAVKVEDPAAGHFRLLSIYTDSDMHNILTYLVTLK